MAAEKHSETMMFVKFVCMYMYVHIANVTDTDILPLQLNRY